MSPVPDRLLAARAAQAREAADLLEQAVGGEPPDEWDEHARDLVAPMRALAGELAIGYGDKCGVHAQIVVEVVGPGNGVATAEVLTWQGVLAGAPRPTAIDLGGRDVDGSTIDPGGDAPALIVNTVDYRLDGSVYVECQDLSDPPGTPVGATVRNLRAAGFRGYNETPA